MNNQKKLEVLSDLYEGMKSGEYEDEYICIAMMDAGIVNADDEKKAKELLYELGLVRACKELHGVFGYVFSIDHKYEYLHPSYAYWKLDIIQLAISYLTE